LATVDLLLLMTLLKFHILSNHRFKQRFCDLFLRGESEKRIDDLSRIFTDRYLKGILNSSVVEALLDHQRLGDEVYLVSSNFTFVLRPLQHTWNSRGVIATATETKEGRFTGELCGRSCYGPEKLSRVLDLFGPERVKEATAYGDGRNDRQLLAFVKKAVWV